MNYQIFHDIESGAVSRQMDESEQAFMERALTQAYVPPPQNSVHVINDMLRAEFVSCRADEMELCAEFAVADWELNPSGTLHGGLLGTAIDMTMGVLVRFRKRSASSVTVQLSVNYLRALHLGERFVVHAQIDKFGHRVVFVHATIVSLATDQVAATATATFM